MTRPSFVVPRLAGFWVFIGGVCTAQRLLLARMESPLSAPRAWLLGFGCATLAAVLAAAAVAVAGAFPLHPGRVAHNLALSAACMAAVAAVASVAEAWFRHALHDNVLPLQTTPVTVFPGRMLMAVNLVAIGHALAFARALRERERSAARLETEVARSSLELLRARVQPQLLYGTLDAIADMVRSDSEAADRALTRMSEYLRGTLYRDRAGSAPAAEQARLLRAYVDMLRPARGAAAVVEVAPGAEDAPLPHLLLESLADVVAPPGTGARVSVVRIGREARGTRIHLAGTAPRAAAEAAIGPARDRLRRLYGPGARAEVRAAGRGSEVAVHLPDPPVPARTEEGTHG
ncbi:MAG: histidine kinase [Gemmatimonadetes bacterium]|nr:histidine kinase [Gemmatimonadota bacterium]